MRRFFLAAPVAIVAALGVAVATGQSPTTPVASHGSVQTASTATYEAQTALMYCVGCHNDRSKAGQLSLAVCDAAAIDQHPGLAEKMIRKLGELNLNATPETTVA